MKRDNKEPFTQWWKDKINKVNNENILLEKRVKALEHNMLILIGYIKTLNVQQAQQPVIQQPVNPQPPIDMPLKYNVIWVSFNPSTRYIKEWERV